MSDLSHIAESLRPLAVPLASLVEDAANVRTHDIRNLDAIKASLAQFGQRSPIIVQVRAGGQRVIRAGNGRFLAARELVHEGDTRWTQLAAVLIEESDTAATAFAIADNRTAELADWDQEALARQLQTLEEEDAELFNATGFDGADLDSLLHELNEAAMGDLASPDITPLEIEQRHRQLDVFFTLSPSDYPCHLLAKGCRWKQGIQSAPNAFREKLLEAWGMLNIHPHFIDNEYHDYDHDVHLACIAAWRPKYCTTRDIMTRAQCEEAGIAYYPLEQILDWAEELGEHAERVILIPKHDIIDRIPQKFVLGYSVPSSYGRTPLPYEAFKGHDVHLLGGPWREQLKGLAALGDDVVSLDNNNVLKIANWGQFQRPGGGVASYDEVFPGVDRSTRAAAITLSLTNMYHDIRTIMGGDVPDEELPF